MRAALCLTVLLAGCAFETTIGPDTMGDDDPANPDIDSDTVLNADDNCPSVANTNQRDHDGDTRGDACDLCPHLASPTAETDGDGDLIGDACDPRVGPDTIVAFEGFYDDSTVLTTWTRSGGAWSVANGKLREAATTFTFISPPAPISRLYVDYSFAPLSVGPAFTITTQQGTTTVQPSIGNFAGTVQQQRSYGCSIAKDPTNRVTAWANQQNTPKSWGGDLVAGTTYRIVENMTTQNRCDFYQGATASDNDSESVGATDGAFGFLISASTVEIDYVFLVAIGS